MPKFRSLPPGTKVRVADHPIQMTLHAFTGVVVRAGKYDDYYVIRLDEPGAYHNADGDIEFKSEIVEHIDNLQIVSVPTIAI